MAHAVEPGGLLFLGYSDPTPVANGLWVKEELEGVRYFRRAFQASFGAVSPAPRREPPPAQIHEDRPQVRKAGPAPHGRKEPPSALRLLESLASDSLFDVDTHVLAAVLADEAGQHTSALTAARQASFLAPDAAFPHFLLARAFGALGEPRRQGAHVALARRCLARVPDTQVPLDHAQGLTAAQLARMIDAAYG